MGRSPLLPVVIAAIFVVGVGVLIGALVLEFVEMWLSLQTIKIEMTGLPNGRRDEWAKAPRAQTAGSIDEGATLSAGAG